jgi:hypothetical protein
MPYPNRFLRLCTAALLLCTAGAAQGQAVELEVQPADTVPLRDLPREVAEPLIELFNDPSTIHFTGRTRIPAERVIVGDVAVLGGPLTLAGRVEGRVLVIDGDVELLPGATITGGLTVVGGMILGLDDGSVAGEVRTFAQRLRYRWRGDRIALEQPARPAPGPARPDGWLARSDFLIASGRSYNRVEGLPITFGPVIETGGSNPTLLRAMAIYRTESGASLDPDGLGYLIRAEQFVGGRRALRVGASLHSMIDPIEDGNVINLENSLSTFLLHRDLRDHYEREGWSVFTTVAPPRQPWEAGVTLRSERHASVATGSPWTLFRNQEVWRAQPLVAEGRLTSLLLDGRWDTRNAPVDPSNGWYVTGQVEQALRSDLVRPGAVLAEPLPIADPTPVAAESYGAGWARGRIDIRRYNRLSPESRLNLRFVAGGSLDGSPLPPQRQHALGGEGSLPGYSLFALDCGARARGVYAASAVGAPITTARDAPPVFVPGYGCDQFALFQAEYRGRLSLRFGWDGLWSEGDGRGWDIGWAAAPDWVAFVDAGQGWGLGRRDEDLALDLGFGLLFQRVGVYLATPLRGEGRVNLLVRLGPRF